ncbi:MAG: hypothetical protein LBQ88_22655, partial [Treponema sp.]|nr:hypothetical protein [Treponema sp.]
DFPGLNPYEKPSDFSPQTRSAASCTARWSILSSKVGIPSSLWDFGLKIPTPLLSHILPALPANLRFDASQSPYSDWQNPLITVTEVSIQPEHCVSAYTFP